MIILKNNTDYQTVYIPRMVLNAETEKTPGMEDYYTIEETNEVIANAVSGKQDTLIAGQNIEISGATISVTGITVPTKVSELLNDSGFITNTVGDLLNYYLKTETYNRNEIEELIASISQFRYVLADELPEPSSATTGVIYLVPSASGAVENIKDEFITIEENAVYKWEQIGSTAIDLSGYVTDDELTAILTGYARLSDIPVNVSELVNDSGYLSSTDFKTINGESIVGSGDIKIAGGATFVTVEGSTLEFNGEVKVVNNTLII